MEYSYILFFNEKRIRISNKIDQVLWLKNCMPGQSCSVQSIIDVYMKITRY